MAAPLPIIKAPMAGTDMKRPFHHPGWVFEEKVDGWCVLAYKDATGVRLVSRNGRDLTRGFPELAAAVARLEPPTLLLDGEIAVFDRQLVSHFEWLRGEPGECPALPVGRGLVLPDQALVATLQHLGPRLEAIVGKPARREHQLVAVDDLLEHVPAHPQCPCSQMKQPRYREGERGWEPKT